MEQSTKCSSTLRALIWIGIVRCLVEMDQVAIRRQIRRQLDQVRFENEEYGTDQEQRAIFESLVPFHNVAYNVAIQTVPISRRFFEDK
ncbi:hypothetical protein L5515_000105 [Caenorhabditis briggsae]|uniref:Uncharacterized protein n=1 Tax=Caenorhabditis briggsae TaxID=6238 RepID=A0AAE9DZJ6_CAEBR|nr:hypothetical protein L5515_000105 [Caenorhabditis briggsae]